MLCSTRKVEYEYCGVRVLSRIRLSNGKLRKVWWIEIYSYDTNSWNKLREIEPVPKGAIIESFYEYGNGDAVPPFWDRVLEKMSKIKTEYTVVQYYDKFEHSHYSYTNCFGMRVYKADELYRILILKRK